MDQSHLAFQFNLPRKMETREVAEVESLINGWVEADTPLTSAILPFEDAKARGALFMAGV